MTMAAPGQLNVIESPLRGSCSVDCSEKLEQSAKALIEQLNKIFDLCGGPDEVNWPGVAKTSWYNQFKPTRPMKRRGKFLDILIAMHWSCWRRCSHLIQLRDPLDAEYFWTDPLPCDPKSLPKYDSSHEFRTKKKRQQQRQNEENAKRLKMQHPPQDTHLPPIQQGGQHGQMRQGPAHPIHGSQPAVAAGPSHHYGKPRGPFGGNLSGEYNHPNRGGQGGGAGYGSGPCPPQGRGAPYGSSGMPAGTGGGRCGGGAFGVGTPNYPQGGPPYGGSAAGRGNRNQQYG